MSQQWQRLQQISSWEHRYVAIFKCSPKAEVPEEMLVADGAEIKASSDLLRVLVALHTGLMGKREYPDADNPTIRRLTFRPNTVGQSNTGLGLLNAMRRAKNKEQVHKHATALAERYLKAKKVQPGALIFLVSRIKVEDITPEPCVFVFKCDFEHISQLTRGRIFKPVEDAFEEEAKKGAQYPHLAGRQFDETRVRVFDALGQTQYWLDFLDLEPRPPRFVPLHNATVQALEHSHPGLAAKYVELLTPTREGRTLAGEERTVAAGDLLPIVETQKVIARLPDDVDKKRIKLQLDEITIEVPLKEYGKTWMFAEQSGERYLVVKGFKLKVLSEWPTPLDFAGLGNLSQALSTLGITKR